MTLRAIDAIRVATAEGLIAEATEPLEFWTHDGGQATAALSRGLTVRGTATDDVPPGQRDDSVDDSPNRKPKS